MLRSKEKRCRTSSEYVYYALQLYSSGLSLRKTSERLSALIRRNHVSIWNWIQRYKPKRIFQSRRSISTFIIDETLIKAGSDYVWLWVAIEPKYKMILGIRISIERSMLVAEQFIVINEKIWKAQYFNRWWNMVSTGTTHLFLLLLKIYFIKFNM
jgi:transposase-like protein